MNQATKRQEFALKRHVFKKRVGFILPDFLHFSIETLAFKLFSSVTMVRNNILVHRLGVPETTRYLEAHNELFELTMLFSCL